MLKLFKRIWIPCLLYWAMLFAQLLFLNNATEEWMILGILVICTYRLMLWVSPFVLSGIVWSCGLIKRRWPVWQVLIVYLIVMVLNFLPYYHTYLLTGGWF